MIWDVFVFWKLVFKNFLFLFIIRKVDQRKNFPVKEKLVFRKVFSFYFGQKTLSRNYENFRNIILFVDYIKFGPQNFDCYIYFVLNIYFQFHPLKFIFYINFGPYFYNCYLLFPYHFLIEIFYLSNLVLIILIVTILFEII
jgi:hypothetical protein